MCADRARKRFRPRPSHHLERRFYVNEPQGHPHLIVGIGASAGGLEAFTQLLSQLPERTGMALVLVQHLAPEHESKLAELLSRATLLPVSEVMEDTEVRPDHVYVIPPNATMTLSKGVLRLSARPDSPRRAHPIDEFFRSLAEEEQSRAVGVVLSGTGADGTQGLSEIKSQGGITFAQDEQSAKFGGMPQSAIQSGSVDFVLAPQAIAQELVRISRHLDSATGAFPAGGSLPAENEPHLNSIFAVMRAAKGVDFSHYRHTTLGRRIARRMIVQGKLTLEEYARHLQENGPEIDALHKDFLINVTSFFRDPPMFDVLKSMVFPEILKTRTSEAIRMWVPGCSTGQEAYSLAIALLESLEEKQVSSGIQVFATDVSEPGSINRARGGLYPESIEAEVSPERLRRFFERESGGYRISKAVRDACIFAKHNLVADPPFSKMDLISCRNLLIYLGPGLQDRVIETFHYALNPQGLLVLGNSETVGKHSDLFKPVDEKHRVYARNQVPHRPYPHFSRQPFPGAPRLVPHEARSLAAEFQKVADQILLSRFAPAGVLVNERLDILQFRGHTGRYLEPPAGEASFNLLKMAREGLTMGLRSAILDAKKQEEPLRRKMRLRTEAGMEEITVEVVPVRAGPSSERCFLVLFEEAGSGHEAAPAALPDPSTAPGDSEREMAHLRREHAAAKEYLQSLSEEYDASIEEQKSANEEILSSNEELQSTNEELETAKEEIQSSNEELTTLNEQLQNRNQELTHISDDLINLLSSTDIPVVMVGGDFRIRRFTPEARRLLNLIPTDLGRPIGDIRPSMDLPGLEEMVLEVIDTMSPREREVQDRKGRWYVLRVRPYRTAKDRIDGAVLAFIDIDELKRVLDQVLSIVKTVPLPTLLLDAGLRVYSANQAFYKTFEVSKEETEGNLIYHIGNGQWNIPTLRRLLEDVLPANSVVENFEVDHQFASIGYRTMLVNARRLSQAKGRPEMILMAISDLTEERRVQKALKEADRIKDEFLAVLSHEMRNPLAPLVNALDILRRGAPNAEATELARGVVDRQVEQLVRLVDDLLDLSRITARKLELRKKRCDLAEVLKMAAETCRPLIDSLGHQLTVTPPQEASFLEGDPGRLVQCLVNLLNNAAKFTEPGGRISLSAERVGEEALLRVRDTGIGIPREMLSRVFDSFTQVNGSRSRSAGGLGLGLALVRKLIEMHGGKVEAHSAGPGQGSEFVVHLPLASASLVGREEKIQEPPVQCAAPSRSYRVMVVDDNMDSTAVLRMLLQMQGHKVEVAHSGQRALEEAAAFHPQVVLLDIGLPLMDGHEVARRIRKLPGLKQVFLVAITGWGQEEDRRRSREAGFDHHLVKPVDAGVLLSLLRSLPAPTAREGA